MKLEAQIRLRTAEKTAGTGLSPLPAKCEVNNSEVGDP